MTALIDLARKFAWPLFLALLAILAVALVWAMLSDANASKAAEKATVARATVTVSKAGDNASTAALEATAGLGEREVARAAEDREHRDEILSQPNARDDAGATGAAGLGELCKRAVYRNHPRCVGLRPPHPAPAPR